MTLNWASRRKCKPKCSLSTKIGLRMNSKCFEVWNFNETSSVILKVLRPSSSMAFLCWVFLLVLPEDRIEIYSSAQYNVIYKTRNSHFVPSEDEEAHYHQLHGYDCLPYHIHHHSFPPVHIRKK